MFSIDVDRSAITRFARRTRHAVKMSSLWTRCPRYLCHSCPSPNFIFFFARDPIVFPLAFPSAFRQRRSRNDSSAANLNLEAVARISNEGLARTSVVYVLTYSRHVTSFRPMRNSRRKKILPTVVRFRSMKRQGEGRGEKKGTDLEGEVNRGGND